MKKKQFRKLITDTSIILGQYKEMRVGQCLMNVLFRIDEDYYNYIASKSFNPFYDDRKVNEFLNFIIISEFDGRDRDEVELISLGLQVKHIPFLFKP